MTSLPIVGRLGRLCAHPADVVLSFGLASAICIIFACAASLAGGEERCSSSLPLGLSEGRGGDKFSFAEGVFAPNKARSSTLKEKGQKKA